MKKRVRKKGYISQWMRRTAGVIRYYYGRSRRVFGWAFACYALMAAIAVTSAFLTQWVGWHWTGRSFLFFLVLCLLFYILGTSFVIRGWFILTARGDRDHVQRYFQHKQSFATAEEPARTLSPLHLSDETGIQEISALLLLAFAIWMAIGWFLFLRRWIADGSAGSRTLSLFLIHIPIVFVSVRLVCILRRIWDWLVWFHPCCLTGNTRQDRITQKRGEPKHGRRE